MTETILLTAGIILMALLCVPLIIMGVFGYKNAQRRKRAKESARRRGY